MSVTSSPQQPDPSDAQMPPASSDPLHRLADTIRALLGPDGCAWNREQTHESLVRYLVEETSELVDAIEAGTHADVEEELGDVLYQVFLHAQMASDAGWGFGIEDVAASVDEKMRRRHPHVFGDDPARTIPEIEQMWKRVKAEEKASRTSVLDGVAQSMPALSFADKVIGRAESLGLVEAGAPGGVALGTEEDLGGLLLAIVASARSHGLDAERALRSTVRTLESEIRSVEAQRAAAGA